MTMLLTYMCTLGIWELVYHDGQKENIFLFEKFQKQNSGLL